MIREKTSTLPKWRPAYVIHLALAVTVTAAAAGPQAAVPQSDSSFIDANGTAHVTRVVPVPKTLSPAAQKILARQVSDAIVPETLAQRRSKTDTWQARAGAEAKQLYPVNISDGEIAGVEVRLVTPLEISAGSQDRVLINLHGGGFNSDSGSLTETIPIANLTLIRVIAVLYRLAPEHPFPAAVDDAVAVYQEVLKTHKPENVGLYGTSAGAILTSEVAVKLRQLRIPMPGAMGVFSGNGDFSKYGDSSATYGLNGFSGPLQVPGETLPDSSYVGAHRSHRSGLIPGVCRSQGLSTNSIRYQHARPAVKWNHNPAPGLPARRRRCRVSGFRSFAACLLEQRRASGIERSGSDHGCIFREAPDGCDED